MLVFADKVVLRNLVPAISKAPAQTEHQIKFILPILQYGLSYKPPADQFGLLTPEELAYELRNKLGVQSPDSTIQSFRGANNNDTLAGSIHAIRGTLGNVEQGPKCFHGDNCIAASLKDTSFMVKVYFPIEAQQQVLFLANNVVTVYGICKWDAPYQPGSGAQISSALRVVSLFED